MFEIFSNNPIDCHRTLIQGALHYCGIFIKNIQCQNDCPYGMHKQLSQSWRNAQPDALYRC